MPINTSNTYDDFPKHSDADDYVITPNVRLVVLGYTRRYWQDIRLFKVQNIRINLTDGVRREFSRFVHHEKHRVCETQGSTTLWLTGCDAMHVYIKYIGDSN